MKETTTVTNQLMIIIIIALQPVPNITTRHSSPRNPNSLNCKIRDAVVKDSRVAISVMEDTWRLPAKSLRRIKGDLLAELIINGPFGARGPMISIRPN